MRSRYQQLPEKTLMGWIKRHPDVFTCYYDDVMAMVKRIFDNYVKHKQMPAATKTG
jgi:phenolic acid decarboxylase